MHRHPALLERGHGADQLGFAGVPPLGAVRHAGAGQQHEAPGADVGESLRHPQAENAGAAGDQIRATRRALHRCAGPAPGERQPGRPGRRRRASPQPDDRAATRVRRRAVSRRPRRARRRRPWDARRRRLWPDPTAARAPHCRPRGPAAVSTHIRAFAPRSSRCRSVRITTVDRLLRASRGTRGSTSTTASRSELRVGRRDLGRVGVDRVRHVGRGEVAGHELRVFRRHRRRRTPRDGRSSSRHGTACHVDVVQHPRKVAACRVFEFLERHSGERCADRARLLGDQHVGGGGAGPASDMQDGHRGRAAVHLHTLDPRGHPQPRRTVEDRGGRRRRGIQQRRPRVGLRPVAVGGDPREQLAVAAVQFEDLPTESHCGHTECRQGVHDVVRRQGFGAARLRAADSSSTWPRRSSMSSSAAATALLWVSQPPSSAGSSSSTNRVDRVSPRSCSTTWTSRARLGATGVRSRTSTRSVPDRVGAGVQIGDGSQERIQNHCSRDDFGVLHGMVPGVRPVARGPAGSATWWTRQLRSRPSARRAACGCRRRARRGRRAEVSACARSADAATASPAGRRPRARVRRCRGRRARRCSAGRPPRWPPTAAPDGRGAAPERPRARRSPRASTSRRSNARPPGCADTSRNSRWPSSAAAVDRLGEAHPVTQIGHPVVLVAGCRRARIGQCRCVQRNLGGTRWWQLRGESAEFSGERVHRRAVKRHVGVDPAHHHAFVGPDLADLARRRRRCRTPRSIRVRR